MPVGNAGPGSAHRATYAPPDVTPEDSDEPVSDEMAENIVRGVEAYRNGEQFYTTEHMLKILDSDDEQ